MSEVPLPFVGKRLWLVDAQLPTSTSSLVIHHLLPSKVLQNSGKVLLKVRQGRL